MRPGWEILKIAGADLAPVVAKLNETYAGSTLRDLMLRRAILGRLDSDAAARSMVEFLDAAGKRVSKTLTPVQPKGEQVQFGYLNPMQVWFNSREWATGTSVTSPLTRFSIPSGS